jgi:hypothetical protein
VNTPLSSTVITGIAIIDGNLYMRPSESDKFYKSSDNGSTWTPVNIALEDIGVFDLIKREDFLFAFTDDGGTYLSSDDGNNWSPIIFPNSIDFLSAITASGGNIYIGTAMYGVYMSTDRGSTWTAINSGLSGGGLLGISLLSDGESLYAGTAAGAWKRSLSEVVVLNASPTSLSIGAPSNSTATLNITSNVNWTVSSPETWLSVSSSTGTGNATITLTAQKNPTTNTRMLPLLLKEQERQTRRF